MPMEPPVGPAWEFRYQVVRVWERPAAEFLGGPLGLLPLAPLAGVELTDLPDVIDRMKQRLNPEPDRPLVAKLWTASYLLMGLAFDEAVIDRVLSGVLQMEESVTYQAIVRRGLQQGLQQGAAQEGQRMLLIAGEQKFGAPTAGARAAISQIMAPERLEALVRKVFRVATWDELFAGE